MGKVLAFDLAVRNAVHQHASPPLTNAMLTMSFIGEPYIVLPLTALACLLFWRAGLAHRARLLIIAMGGEVILEQTIKAMVHRPRPEPFFHYPLPTSYSFPSGHAFASTVFFGMLAALISPLLSSVWQRILIFLAAIVMATAIGFSRVYLGVHYPSDVIAGYLGGLAWLYTLSVVKSL
ncbi:MAG: phosphatase PAP2 family protein [Bryobacteraceae bacterium]|jgi:undecaprenyl-diphosphatase